MYFREVKEQPASPRPARARKLRPARAYHAYPHCYAMKGGPLGGKIAAIADGQQTVERAFRDWVLQPEFPCVGAKAAFNAGTYSLRLYPELADPDTTAALAADLLEFTRSPLLRESDYATFVAVFESPKEMDEREFERRLWLQLGSLNAIDAAQFAWDPSVRSDPADPQFSFSFGGQSLYVIGLHSNSCREARTFPWPALVFNPHEQFERLRTDGKWKRMQETIRERDVQLQGSVNPMLSDFGERSEARQYSGRAVEENWQPPFVPAPAVPNKSRTATGRCPFAH